MYVEESVAVKRCDKIVNQAWKDVAKYINDMCGHTAAKSMITKLGAKAGNCLWKKFPGLVHAVVRGTTTV